MGEKFSRNPPPLLGACSTKWASSGGDFLASNTSFELILSFQYTNLRIPSVEKKIILIGALVEKKMEQAQTKDPNSDHVAGTALTPRYHDNDHDNEQTP